MLAPCAAPSRAISEMKRRPSPAPDAGRGFSFLDRALLPAEGFRPVFFVNEGAHPLPRHLQQLMSKLGRQVVLVSELHTILSIVLEILSGRHGTTLHLVPSVPDNAIFGTEFHVKS